MLPAPLILSADLRPGAPCGGIDDPRILQILTNAEVIAVNQDEAALPMRPVRRCGRPQRNDTTRRHTFVHSFAQPVALACIACMHKGDMREWRVVRRMRGLEVWRKSLAAPGSVAITFFHRNDTAAGTHMAEPAPSPPPPHLGSPIAGTPLALVPCGEAVAFNVLDVGPITLRANDSFCVGQASWRPPTPPLPTVAVGTSRVAVTWMLCDHTLIAQGSL